MIVTVAVSPTTPQEPTIFQRLPHGWGCQHGNGVLLRITKADGGKAAVLVVPGDVPGISLADWEAVKDLEVSFPLQFTDLSLAAVEVR